MFLCRTETDHCPAEGISLGQEWQVKDKHHSEKTYRPELGDQVKSLGLSDHSSSRAKTQESERLKGYGGRSRPIF